MVPQDPGLVVSPADGKVMIAGPSDRRWAPPGDWKQITIFLSPMDVHMNRTPVDGRVTRIDYQPGKFLPAYDEASNDNEFNEIWIDHGGQTVVVRQVVGILARRIVCRVSEGQPLARGERIGLMKFGSRMDVFLPPHAELSHVGQRRRDTVGRRARRCWPALRRSDTGVRQFSITCRAGAARRTAAPRFRRGVYLLPSLLTVANLFCGYACVVYAMRADFDTAALLIGIAMISTRWTASSRG